MTISEGYDYKLQVWYGYAGVPALVLAVTTKPEVGYALLPSIQVPPNLLTRFNKIATQGAPQMAVDKEANSLSRVYSYYSKFNLRLFYV